MKKIKKVKIAVIGVGHLGKHHVKHYSKLDNVDLVGVLDTDLQISKSIAEKYKIRNFKNYNELIDHVDAVSIVTPTKTIKEENIEYFVDCFLANGVLEDKVMDDRNVPKAAEEVNKKDRDDRAPRSNRSIMLTGQEFLIYFRKKREEK